MLSLSTGVAVNDANRLLIVFSLLALDNDLNSSSLLRESKALRTAFDFHFASKLSALYILLSPFLP